MNLEMALELFGINSLGDITDKGELRKKYKKLMIKFHPDNNGGKDDMAKDVVEAYNVLISILDSVELMKLVRGDTKEERVFTVISYNDIVKLYRGDEIKLKKKDKCFILNKNTLFKYDIYLLLEWDIVYNGEVKHYEKIVKPDMLRKYSVSSDILVESLNKVDIVLKVYGNNKDISINYNSSASKVKLLEEIELEVTVVKKLLDNSK